MPNPWEAERDITAEQAAALITSQFPHLAPVHAMRMGSGWDNSAFLVNGEFVFRFPRRDFALQFFEAENRVLPALAGRLSLAPLPLYFGAPTDDYPWPFAGYRMLPGRTACAVHSDEVIRTRLAIPLGKYLRRLHSISADEAAAMGAGPDAIRRLDWNYRAPYARKDLTWAVEAGYLPADLDDLTAIIDDAEPDEADPETTLCLVHGDLYVRHNLNLLGVGQVVTMPREVWRRAIPQPEAGP